MAASCFNPSVRTKNAAAPVVAQMPSTAAKAAIPIEIGSRARPSASSAAVRMIIPTAKYCAPAAAATRISIPPARAIKPIAS